MMVRWPSLNNLWSVKLRIPNDSSGIKSKENNRCVQLQEDYAAIFCNRIPSVGLEEDEQTAPRNFKIDFSQVRVARVMEIRAAIADGLYTISAADLAQKLIDTMVQIDEAYWKIDICLYRRKCMSRKSLLQNVPNASICQLYSWTM